MAVPERSTDEPDTPPADALASIDVAITATQGAIAGVADGTARRILYDAAIYLDTARSLLRNGSR
jgi:hypothetical protein